MIITHYETKAIVCLKCGRVSRAAKHISLKLAWCPECRSSQIRLYREENTLEVTENEKDLLKALYWSGHEWHRPMDIGGRDGSNHSTILAGLVKKGLVERKTRSAYYSRPSYLYRLTDAGKALPIYEVM